MCVASDEMLADTFDLVLGLKLGLGPELGLVLRVKLLLNPIITTDGF